MKDNEKFDLLRERVVQWASDRNLIEGSRPKDQVLKLVQEVGELSDSVCKGKDAADDVGDITVVLLILCEQLNLDFLYCLNTAYEDIRYRKGRMVDGIFVKEE